MSTAKTVGAIANLFMTAQRFVFKQVFPMPQEGPAQARFSLSFATVGMGAPANDWPARCEAFSWNVGFFRQQILFSVSKISSASANTIYR